MNRISLATALFLLLSSFATGTPAAGAPATGTPAAGAPALFHDDFERDELGADWKTHPNAFTIRDGHLVVQQQPGTDHGAVGETLVDFGDARIEFRFRFAGGKSFNLVVDDKNYRDSHAGHICRVRVSPRRLVLGDDKFGVMENEIFAMRRGTKEEKKEANRRIADTLATIPVELGDGAWHHLAITLAGETMALELDGETIGSLSSPGIAHPTKTDFGFTVNGGELHFDDVKLTKPGASAAAPVAKGHGGPAGSWPVDRLQSEVPDHRIENGSGPIQSIVYAGEPVDGVGTEVFAFYASPKTLGTLEPGRRVPGVVLIHGGGGTAFSDWVWMWARRGYAAIAMDLSGRRPPAPQFDENGEKIRDYHHDRAERVRLEKGGLGQTHAEKFGSIGGTIDDDWPYHAVANVMKAHTLLDSFPEVDPDRTAVTGISWGGYTTSLAASIDDRFQAAAPVYGCGFLHEGESVQKPSIDALGDRRQAWIDAYDPGSHLGQCSVPTLWVNGTHDKHYVLDSYAKSYELVRGRPRVIRIEPRMGHSHPAGWAPREIEIFFDSLLREGKPLPTIGDPSTTADGIVRTSFESPVPIAGAELHYTTEEGPRTERQWRKVPAKVEPGGGDSGDIVAKGLPGEANTWLLTVTDERGAMVSSPVSFR